MSRTHVGIKASHQAEYHQIDISEDTPRWAVPGGVRARLNPLEWPGLSTARTSSTWCRYRRAWVASYCQMAWVASVLLAFSSLPLVALLAWAGWGYAAAWAAAFLLAGQLACAGVGVSYTLWRARENRRFAQNPLNYNLALWGGPSGLSPQHVAELMRHGEVDHWEHEQGLDTAARETFLALSDEWTSTTDDLVRASRQLSTPS